MKKTIIPITILLAVALIALAFLFLRQRSQMTEMVEQIEFEKEELQNEYEDLTIQLDGYQNLDIQNDSLQDLLGKEQQRVLDLLEELRITKATNARRIAELKQELATVRTVMVGYVRQIDSLHATNERLTAENQQLTQNYRRVSSQAEELRAEKTQLTAVVERASMLEINHFEMIGLNKRDRKTRVVSQIAKFQINYTLAKNITCEPGMKIIYLRVVDPNGNIINELSDRLFDFESSQLTYSSSKEIEFTGEEQTGSLYIPLKEEAAQGFYNADFFIDGNLIGSFPFEIRK